MNSCRAWDAAGVGIVLYDMKFIEYEQVEIVKYNYGIGKGLVFSCLTSWEKRTETVRFKNIENSSDSSQLK